MKARRRHVATHIPNCGERHHKSKLTEAQVEAILLMPWHVRTSEIARTYEVDARAIARIRKGLQWKHVYRRVMYAGYAI
jgi:hypothetical protein